MNHKRGRPKHQRAGCLLCKPHKDERGANGFGAQPLAERRYRVAARVDGPVTGAADEDEPGAPRCAWCLGEVCDLPSCPDHPDAEFSESSGWTCCRECREHAAEAIQAL